MGIKQNLTIYHFYAENYMLNFHFIILFIHLKKKNDKQNQIKKNTKTKFNLKKKVHFLNGKGNEKMCSNF